MHTVKVLEKLQLTMCHTAAQHLKAFKRYCDSLEGQSSHIKLKLISNRFLIHAQVCIYCMCVNICIDTSTYGIKKQEYR